MGGKKATFTCKVCGGEHAGLICTKYNTVKVLQPARQQGKTEALRQLTGPAKPIDRVSTPEPAVIDVEATDVTISPAPPVTKSPARTGRPKTGAAKTAAQRKADSRSKAKAAKA